jgi:predicted nuclease of restriction endonuclease-like RecB superfamily
VIAFGNVGEDDLYLGDTLRPRKGPKTKELLSTLQQYTADQRDQAVKKIDGLIDVLESSVDSKWDQMTQADRQKIRANLKALHQQRKEIADNN